LDAPGDESPIPMNNWPLPKPRPAAQPVENRQLSLF
jgi:hypothetical protein